MISRRHNLMTYIALVVTATYILSVGSVYAQQSNQTNQTGQTVQDIKMEAVDSAIESLQKAKQAYDAGNVTGALDLTHAAVMYLQSVDLPKNCELNNNQMLQCNFPG
jgi:cation transport regulator ChaB